MKLFSIVLIYPFFFFCSDSVAQNEYPKIYGVTIDDIGNLNAIETSLVRLSKKPTTRIVFDEWIPATQYITAVRKIHRVSNIMGLILDSYYMRQYNLQQFQSRVREYIDRFSDTVDIWEIGNEVNGEWLGRTDSVIEKISYAFSYAKEKGLITSMTLYYNKNCWGNPQNEMFRWVINNVPHKLKKGLDYVLVSYYEDDCNNYQPNWQLVFDSLRTIFPYAKLGIGECGTTITSRKEEYMTRYYTMNITTPGYIGGYFWWYYKQDCVPYTKYLWGVLNNLFLITHNYKNTNEKYYSLNYPNPFNPKTKIKFDIRHPFYESIDSKSRGLTPHISKEGTGVVLKIYDILGSEIATLVNEQLQPGTYEVEWDASNFSSGVYFYQLASEEFIQTRRIILIK